MLKPKNEAVTAFLALLDITLPTCVIVLEVSLKLEFFKSFACCSQMHLLKNYDY